MDESRRRRRVAIRWAAIVPAAFLLWYATLLLAGGLAELVLTFCPATARLGDYCAADWARTAERAITVGCAGLAALLIVYCAALLAPAFRLRVALVIYVIGLVVAYDIATEAGAIPEFFAALGGGLLGVVAARGLPQSATV